jgi:anti-sigma regulatory factor (Ser/Thr protein kinase)
MSEPVDLPSSAEPGYVLSMVLNNDRRELSRLADALEQFRRRCRVSGDDAANINVVLDELINNIINYAYADADAHQIAVSVRLDGDIVTIAVEDDGRPFNPLAEPPPDLDLPIEQRPIGGLGIFLVRALADSVEYSRAEGRNIVTARKTVTLEPSS